jgi:leucyl-tRNA synthetase
MELVNELTAAEAALTSGEVPPSVVAELLRSLILLLAPFAPFLSAELWAELGETSEILRQPWPVSDPALAKEDEIEIPVQVNGKLRAVIRVPVDADSATIQATALANEKVLEWLAGKTPAKVIIVPGKLVNLVVK